MYKRPASLCLATAALVLAICMREMMPSCMRAPPLKMKPTTGRRFAAAYSKVCAIFSPTAWPMLPIWKR